MERRERGFTLIELLVVISIIALLIGILLPAIGKARDGTLITKSLSNLKQFGVAHATYASEWEGRQWTTCPDDFTLAGAGYRTNYITFERFIPPVPLGFDKNGLHHQTRNHIGIVPMWYPGNCSLGSFRFFHFKPFNQYINGKVYDQIFWAPKDYTLVERTHQWSQDPGEWPADYPIWPHDGQGNHDNDSLFFTQLISSYCTSVAAQTHPDVWRGPQDGNWQHPLNLAAGHRSPSLGSARYPDLKSHMVEHRWLQNPPSPHIPGTGDHRGGVPWFYCMGADSTPATLFFDGHIRMMSTREAVRSSRRVVAQGDDPLDVYEACFGTNGYFLNHAYAGQRGEVNSWHIFTRDGVLGRDTLGDG